MNQKEQLRGYQGSYWMGFLIIGVAGLRTILFYQSQSNFIYVLMLLFFYLVYYGTEPWLSSRISWYKFFYFPVQTSLVLLFTLLRPFLDFQTLLYIPLIIQAFHTISGRAAIFLSVLYIFLVAIAIIPSLGWLEGTAFILLGVTVCAFFISYDFLYSRTQADRAESQRLLVDLQDAHRKLEVQAAQAEELAVVRERNRLARELHDSVSQSIFSITLTSQSARLLLERDSSRVPEMLERLREMTSSALSQLRSLIAELRPPQNS